MFVPGGLSAVAGRGRPGRRSTAKLEGALLYREVQGCGWPWPGMLVVFVGVLTFGAVLVPFGYGMWQQLVLGRPWGDRPIPDIGLAVVGPLAILLSLLPFAALFSTLVVEVRQGGIRIELVRLRAPHIISCEEVRGAALAHIGPIGWGSSRHGGRFIYRMAGFEGISIELANGGRVLLGSEHSRSLLDAVRSMIDAPHRR
jgi:hypothetical protein